MTYDNYRHWIIYRIKKNSIPGNGGCIEYAGGKLKHRYGLISITLDMVRKSVPAHRAMWMAVNDRLDLPREMVIRHKCGNPCCVNIEHLEMGTHKKNIGDCVKRGRRSKTYKLHTRQRKFTNEQILDIRNGKEKPGYYMNKYGISSGYISKIRRMEAKTLVA